MAERTRSWLSPKRRRTTGNLKTLGNGKSGSQEGNTARPTTPTTMGTSKTERSASPSPLSQAYAPSSNGSGGEADGNLFYAYARKGDDLASRYLLTFASASVANEWHSLVKSIFPSLTRPGPQLFSFKTDDLLSKAWRHPTLEHLQTKWMYISFSDTSSEGIGGAAQGIIPVQDAHGNLLGGATSPSSSPEIGKARKEVRDMREGVGRLEEHFEQMMDAVERNTEGVRKLAEERGAHQLEQNQDSQKGGSFDMSELSGYFGRMTDLLERNTERMETLSKQQVEHEQRLIQALENVNSRQQEHRSDISKLSSHLGRIQTMMEESARARRDSASALDERATKNLSPLTDGLEKVQVALEQNSSLMGKLLERRDGQDAGDSGLLFAPSPIDSSALDGRLGSILAAVQEQNSHMKAFVDARTSPSPGARPEDIDLTPLTERLNRIHDSLEKANKLDRPSTPGSGDPKFVLNALTSHLSKIQAVTEQNAHAIKTLSSSNATSNDDTLHQTLEALRKQSARVDSKQLRLDERRGIDMDAVDKRLEATNSQIRELMAGHREMTKVMRELAEAITAQNKGSCDHVVIPPPRKVGRKIVGFVYDGKEGVI